MCIYIYLFINFLKLFIIFIIFVVELQVQLQIVVSQPPAQPRQEQLLRAAPPMAGQAQQKLVPRRRLQMQQVRRNELCPYPDILLLIPMIVCSSYLNLKANSE